MRTQWNTGRQYTEEGQVIVAFVEATTIVESQGTGITVKTRPGHIVRFFDHSRNVGGYFHVERGVVSTEFDLKTQVMHHYDYNDYRHDMRESDYPQLSRNPQVN